MTAGGIDRVEGELGREKADVRESWRARGLLGAGLLGEGRENGCEGLGADAAGGLENDGVREWDLRSVSGGRTRRGRGIRVSECGTAFTAGNSSI